MWKDLDRLPFGIRFTIVMLAYLVLSSFLSRFVSLALSQAIAIPMVSLLSFLVLSERRGFLRHMFYGVCAGLLVFALLEIFS